MVLSLQEIELLLDTITGFADRKFERLPRLWWTLQHKNIIKCNNAPQSLNTIKARNTPRFIRKKLASRVFVTRNRYTRLNNKNVAT